MSKKKPNSLSVGDYAYVVKRQGSEALEFFRTWQLAVQYGLDEGDTVYIVEVKSKQQAKLTLR